jgi:hypothetical protein
MYWFLYELTIETPNVEIQIQKLCSLIPPDHIETTNREIRSGRRCKQHKVLQYLGSRAISICLNSRISYTSRRLVLAL